MSRLDFSIEDIKGHEGQKYMIYSKAMRCEIPAHVQDVPDLLKKMFHEYLDHLDVDISGRRNFRVHMGASVSSAHSYRDFNDQDHALSFLWAMAHSPSPETCWYWQGRDGWMSNKHMAGKSFPARLEDLCEFYLQEDQKLFNKEMENA